MARTQEHRARIQHAVHALRPDRLLHPVVEDRHASPARSRQSLSHLPRVARANVKVFPFKQGPYLNSPLEVAKLILTEPATVRLPGRNAEYQAPAGFYRRQFPGFGRPREAQIVRGGKVVLTLEHPSPSRTARSGKITR